MNQRRKPKDSAQGAEPSNKTLIIRPGGGEQPTQALDARSTYALKGSEAQRMKEATQAMPLQAASPDEITGALPLQASPSEEPTVALHIRQVPAARTQKLPIGEPEGPDEQLTGASTQQVPQQDIAWVAGEIPDDPETELEVGKMDPTSRMKVKLSDLTRIVKDKEVPTPPPESRQTTRLPVGEPTPPDLPLAADATYRLSRFETEQALLAGEPGTSQVPTIQAAEQTLILKPGSEDSPTAPVTVKQGQEKPSIAPLPQVEASLPGQATLVIRPAEETPTAQIEKPAPEPVPATMLMPQQETASPGDATPVVNPSQDVATAKIEKPAPEPAPSTMVMPQLETQSAPEAAAWTMVMPQVQVQSIAEAAPSTMVMPRVETTPVPEPSPSTMVMPLVESKPVPEPAPSTMVMPQVERPRARNQAGGPEGTMPVMRTGPSEAPVRAPATQLLPKVEAPVAEIKPSGPGGTVQLMRTETPEKPAPPPESARTVFPGGTVPVMRPQPAEPRPLAPATPLMPKVEAPPPGGPSGSEVHAPFAESITPAGTVQPTAMETLAVSPVVTLPISKDSPAQGTVRVPVEELSRFSEVSVDFEPKLEAEIPAAPATAGAFSTQRMPQQQQRPAFMPPNNPPLVPTMIEPLAGPGSVPATATPVPAAYQAVAPARANGQWKLWAGFAGLGVIALVGAGLWLRPEFLKMGSDAKLLPFKAGPTREVPASLKAVKEKADAGDASSMRFLGTCYANGLGVPRDVEEAKRWYRRAAEAGSQAAREELANLQRQEK